MGQKFRQTHSESCVCDQNGPSDDCSKRDDSTSSEATMEVEMEQGQHAETVSVDLHDSSNGDWEDCYSKRRESTTHSMSIVRNYSSHDVAQLKLDPHTLTFCRYRKRMSISCDDELYMREANMNHVRLSVGLYKGSPLAQALLVGAPSREKILKEHGVKQTDHIKGTDGWMKSMSAWEPRAIDNIFVPWLIVSANAMLTTLLHQVGGIRFDYAALSHWDTVYSLVLKTSLAFLLVFRLNRCSVRYWEARTMWGNVTRVSRSLVSTILIHCAHHPIYRDQAIRWAGAYCVACMHFIRRETKVPTAELAGFLKRPELDKLEDAEHTPLYVASQIRYFLRKSLVVDENTPVGIAHARTSHMVYLESLIDTLIEQISGMERIRSTPMPVVFTTHLRTFLFVYMLFMPYGWVTEWGWGTFFLVSFTAFALFGIEGAASEVEVPFNKHRPNHLALDAYCVTIMDNIQDLVIHDANLYMQEQQGEADEEDLAEALGSSHEKDMDSFYNSFSMGEMATA